MSFAREKRLLMGLLAFVAPLPLPLNEPRPEGVIGWPFLLTYLAAVGVYLYRAHLGSERWLRPWMLNLLGLAYLPFFILDFSTFWRGHLVRPMMHLVMFALVAKLFSLRRERDKWQVTMGVFFLFLASMATSAHPGIVLYLLLFLVLGLLLLVRFAHFHLSGGYAGDGPSSSAPRSLRPLVVGSAAAAALVAVPLFLLLPRVRTPYVVGRGFAGTQVGYSTGFSDEVTLDVIGNIRSSTEVALRARYESGAVGIGDQRLRGAAYDHYEGLRWRRAAAHERLAPVKGRFRLAEGEPVDRMDIWLQPLDAASLILPVEALALELPGPRRLERSRGGTLSLDFRPAMTMQYRVAVGPQPVYSAAPPSGAADPTLHLDGVTARITDLARAVAGSGSVAQQVRRIESHLITQYEYTLDFVGRRAENPIDDFLFTYGSGHCEYFASAMVLMLRSQAIPARFVTGFLGAEYNPLERYYIVRQSNAHAWVEAYLPEHGWQAYDPTPPSGRPLGQGSSLALLLRQAYDYILFRWDRYVLSYGFDDQVSVFSRLHTWFSQLWSRLLDDPAPRAEGPEAMAEAEAVTEGAHSSGAWRPSRWLLGTLLVLAAATVLLWWLRRPAPSATRAYLRLRRRISRRGLHLDPAVAPLSLGDRVARHFPQAAPATSRLIQFYLRESFRGEKLRPEEQMEVEGLLEAASKRLKRAS